ncbi:hypothetical protein FOZ63_033826, partial [Perkinsus olseni]
IFYHGLSDRVKHKLISEIKDSAIYKDLDRLKDITRHVCRVLSKKAKTKSPSATALDLQEETVDISRPFFDRSLRQAGANNVEATITNDHIRTFNLINVDIYLSTDNKLRYKQSALVDSGASHCFIHPDLIHQWNRVGVEIKVLPAGHAATSSDGWTDPMSVDTAVGLPVTFSTTEGTTITIKCYVYPDLSQQMLLSSSVLQEASCLWFMLPGYADCMLLGDLNCLSLQALCYDGLATNWECTHRLRSCTLQLGTSDDGPGSSDLYADEQEALRHWEELAIAQSPMSVPPTEASVGDFE